jgi:hypothetical protein
VAPPAAILAEPSPEQLTSPVCLTRSLPNQSYTITLSNTSNAVRAGFQLTCLDAANAYAGTLTNGTGTSIGTSNSTGRKYIRQSSPKTLSGGSTSWTFTWKAPASAAENKCTFYFVSLCANGNGNNSGDKVLVANESVVLKAVSAANEPAGDTASLDWLQGTSGSTRYQPVRIVRRLHGCI